MSGVVRALTCLVHRKQNVHKSSATVGKSYCGIESEWFESEGSLKIILFQHLSHGQGHLGKVQLLSCPTYISIVESHIEIPTWIVIFCKWIIFNIWGMKWVMPLKYPQVLIITIAQIEVCFNFWFTEV